MMDMKAHRFLLRLMVNAISDYPSVPQTENN